MKSSTESSRPRRTLPMPLWLQGMVELFLTAAFSACIFMLIFVAIWYTNGFRGFTLQSAAILSGNAWLLVHGVPLHLNIPANGAVASVAGTVQFMPLGFTLLPFLLCFRSGRRLARASYEGQFWVPLLGGLFIYSAFGASLSWYSSSALARTDIWWAALIPVLLAGIGIVAGGLFESRSLTRMIGMDAAETVRKYSQYSRWAGSYVWALLWASWVAPLAFVAGGALLMFLTIFGHWNNILTVYQGLHAGAIGDTALTILQLGIAPNLLVDAMGYSSGAGFYLGQNNPVNWSGTQAGSLPLVPLLSALPQLSQPWVYLVALVPLGAGFIAGWWFFREGEDHLDEWISLKLKIRLLSWILSHLVLALGIGTLSGIWLACLGWISSGSLGLGKFTKFGVDPIFFGAYAALWVAVGTLCGSLFGRFFEEDAKVALERASDPMTVTAQSEEKKKEPKKKRKWESLAGYLGFSKTKKSEGATAQETSAESQNIISIQEIQERKNLKDAQSRGETNLSLSQQETETDSEENQDSPERVKAEPAERPWWEKHTLIREPQIEATEETSPVKEEKETEQKESSPQTSEATPAKTSSDVDLSKQGIQTPRLSRGRVIRRPKAQKKENTDD